MSERQIKKYERRPNEIVEEEKVEVDDTDITNVNVQSTDYTYWKKVAYGVKALADLRKTEMKKWKTRYLNDHQEHVSQSLMQEEISNEFKAVLRKKSEMGKFILEEVMVLFAAHKDIQEVVNEVRPRNWFKFTKWVALTVILGLFIFFAATNENFSALLNENAMFIVVGAVILVGMYLYFDRRDKK
jgi:uncharacterized membrane protein YcjF (UPF0283 family)